MLVTENGINYPYGNHLDMCIMIGCGTANRDTGGFSWAGVFDPDGARGMWFKGYTNPQQSVSKALKDVVNGSVFPKK
ncbi:hypothetical protein M2103_001942 [Ereboglobus sp. PH5-5]|uniref:hypothetical protein n=1 Tax=Ereboglobus sp. PH5-5 TaxID=2940529 RepID=UPI0024058600|nr:hypothetical protein [Ereboglobus sp. PH5-5]MDF9833709.1 hypothetical protein [Ereboglobus sp. PH5-5]